MKYFSFVPVLVVLGAMSSPTEAGRAAAEDLAAIPERSAAPPRWTSSDAPVGLPEEAREGHVIGLFADPQGLEGDATRLITHFPGLAPGLRAPASPPHGADVLLYEMDLDSDVLFDSTSLQALPTSDLLAAFCSIPRGGESGHGLFEQVNDEGPSRFLDRLYRIAGEAADLLPEPAGMAWFGLGLVGLEWALHRRR
jgi:hypothetical protein